MTKNTPFYLFIGYIVISPRCINMFHFLPYIKFGASFANSIKSPLFVVLAKVVSSIVLSFKTKTLSSFIFAFKIFAFKVPVIITKSKTLSISFAKSIFALSVDSTSHGVIITLVIGNDFFNSESDNMTTDKTPQQNDTRYKKLFLVGLELYVKTLYTLKNYFKQVDVMLCSGNHARAMEFFLYIALKEHFATDEVIRFSEDFKDTQYYKFGQCGIFFNHGDANLVRTIKSIPSEFFDVWGRTLYRELHLGHLHKEVTVDDDSGMITRRIGSP